jgi:hypothetical protein
VGLLNIAVIHVESPIYKNKRESDSMKRPKEITAKLKAADVCLAKYTTLLEKENLRLQNQIAKLQVKCISYQNETAAVKKSKPETKIIIQTTPELKKLMEE